jgi:hypothetical protein
MLRPLPLACCLPLPLPLPLRLRFLAPPLRPRSERGLHHRLKESGSVFVVPAGVYPSLRLQARQDICDVGHEGGVGRQVVIISAHIITLVGFGCVAVLGAPVISSAGSCCGLSGVVGSVSASSSTAAALRLPCGPQHRPCREALRVVPRVIAASAVVGVVLLVVVHGPGAHCCRSSQVRGLTSAGSSSPA